MTNKQTHRQTWPITIPCLLCSASTLLVQRDRNFHLQDILFQVLSLLNGTLAINQIDLETETRDGIAYRRFNSKLAEPLEI